MTQPAVKQKIQPQYATEQHVDAMEARITSHVDNRFTTLVEHIDRRFNAQEESQRSHFLSFFMNQKNILTVTLWLVPISLIILLSYGAWFYLEGFAFFKQSAIDTTLDIIERTGHETN